MISALRVAVTGRGVLTPLGCDWQSFSEAMREGRTPDPAPFTEGAIPDDRVLYYPLSNPDAADASGRRDEPLSVLATAAVRQALTDAGLVCDSGPRDDIGLVMTTACGPITAVETYLERLVDKGPRFARPAHFVDTLLSMPASRVGIELGLRGSTAVLGSDNPVELAFDWVRFGREHTVVAGGAEYHSPKGLRYLREAARRSGTEEPLYSQAAGFLVLEQAEHAEARGVPLLAELLGAGAASEPQDVGRARSADPEGLAFATAMRAALAEAGLGASDVTLVTLASGDDAAEGGELAAVRDVLGARAAALPLLRPKRQMGETLSGSGCIGILATLLAAPNGPAVALVNEYAWGGTVTSVAMRVSS